MILGKGKMTMSEVHYGKEVTGKEVRDLLHGSLSQEN